MSQPGQGLGATLPQTGICWGAHTGCRQAHPPSIQAGPEQLPGKDGQKGPLLPPTEQEPSTEQELPGNPQLGQSIINNAWGSPGKACNKCVCSGETACRGHRPHLAGNSRSCCLVLPVTLLLHPPPLPVTLLSATLKEISITSVLAFSIQMFQQNL